MLINLSLIFEIVEIKSLFSFRDCNGVCNGRALEDAAIVAENAAAANDDSRGLALLNKCESRSDTMKI